MRIQHNIMAMNAYRNLGMNNRALSGNLEKLSSGYKINRAGDDAAGLAISEKMRAQITALDAAQKNVNDGISLVKTAEGAMQEIQDMLNRMEYLATQSANGTYDNDVDRNNLQKEVDALKSEINRIADASNFNGTKLLNGALDSDATFVSETGAAIDATAIEVQDGQTASAATAAKTATLTLVAGTHTGLIGKKADGTDITLTNGGGNKLSDLFTITTNATGTNLAAGETISLTAKSKGALSDDLVNELKTLGFDVTNGTDTGSGAAATKSSYKLDFILDDISGGDTFSIDGKTFEFVTDGGDAKEGNTKIDITGLASGVQADQLKMMKAIHTAVSGAMTEFDAPAAPTTGAATYSLTVTAKTAGYDGNDGAVREVETTGSGVAGTYTPGKPDGVGKEGKFAQVAYKADLSKLALGDKIKIGSTELEIVEDDKVDANTGKISLADAQDGVKLAAAFESAGYTAGKIAYADGKLTITDTTAADANTAATFKAGNGKLEFTPKTAPTTTTTNGSALTLQIGDTSDDYNQLKVEIGDMHTKAMGTEGGKSIADIKIDSQTGASEAVSVIKDAINYVSSIRGDLGAIQNRLEHTNNNLAVMEENIQDAEATIRDTDIADEMMAYTKNNILIQSAQAMLAQANQVPQGVLQLMQ